MAEEQTAGYVLMYRNNKNQLHNLTAKLPWVQNAGQAAQFKIPAAVTDWGRQYERGREGGPGQKPAE